MGKAVCIRIELEYDNHSFLGKTVKSGYIFPGFMGQAKSMDNIKGLLKEFSPKRKDRARRLDVILSVTDNNSGYPTTIEDGCLSYESSWAWIIASYSDPDEYRIQGTKGESPRLVTKAEWLDRVAYLIDRAFMAYVVLEKRRAS